MNHIINVYEKFQNIAYKMCKAVQNPMELDKNSTVHTQIRSIGYSMKMMNNYNVFKDLFSSRGATGKYNSG